MGVSTFFPSLEYVRKHSRSASLVDAPTWGSSQSPFPVPHSGRLPMRDCSFPTFSCAMICGCPLSILLCRDALLISFEPEFSGSDCDACRSIPDCKTSLSIELFCSLVEIPCCKFDKLVWFSYSSH